MNKKLYFELLILLAASILAALLIYRLVNQSAESIINTGYVQKNFSEAKEASAVRSFREMAADTDLSASRAPKLDAWVSSHPYIYFLISSSGYVIYSSDNGFTSGIARELSYYSFDADMSSYHRYSVNFKNADYSVYVISFYTNQLYSYAMVIGIILGVAVFVLLFSFFIFKKVRYIEHLSHDIGILEGGNLEYEIPIRGKDEIARLAESLNAMRLTLIRQNEAEAEQKKNSSELVTALSHDLRTPLTTQLGYLEIIKEKLGNADNAELAGYLEKSIANCHQIKDMSDRLFEYFLAYSRNAFDEPVELESFDGSETLMQLITEETVILEESGFSFHILMPEEPFSLQLNIGYMCRVFDNIFSNIRKYADPEFTVNVITSAEAHTCTVSVSNHISKSAGHTESTHIGLISIEGLMRAQNGSGSCHTDNGIFEVQLKMCCL